MLRKASQLLQDAGYPIRNGKRMTPKGEVFTLEFLLDEPSFQPHHSPFIKNLATLGIEASIRLVDPVQFKTRTDAFDFDTTISRLSAMTTPGDAMRSFFSSQSANVKGSLNLAGIADPVIDALIEKIIGAATRAELTTACRAFDRVFRAGRYWMPQWYSARPHPVAYWDMFGRPEKIPRYSVGVGAPEIWWIDSDKAAKLGQK